jgi:hypothetical protein
MSKGHSIAAGDAAESASTAASIGGSTLQLAAPVSINAATSSASSSMSVSNNASY